MKPLLPALGALMLAGTVTGCGLTGDLQRPDPLFGEPDGSSAAELPDRGIERGLPETPGAEREEDDPPADDQPNADDELLGGPSGR